MNVFWWANITGFTNSYRISIVPWAQLYLSYNISIIIYICTRNMYNTIIGRKQGTYNIDGAVDGENRIMIIDRFFNQNQYCYKTYKLEK